MMKKKSWKKILLFLVFIALNIAVIVVTAVSEFGNSANAAELTEVKINWWMLIPAVLCFAVATIINVAKYVIMMGRFYNAESRPPKKYIWKVAWRVVMLGKYYDNVTPAAIGGQPFQIYYMRKNSGLSHGHSSSIPIVAMIAGQIGFLILAVICFALGGVFRENPALLLTACLGLLFYAFWPLMVLGINVMPKQTTRFLQFIVKILAKIRIVKKREEALSKVEDELAEYNKSVKTIIKSRGLFLTVIVLATLFQFFTMSIPYFVIKAFGGDMDFFRCLATTVAVTSAVYFVPTPGNSVAAEGTFFAVFSSLSTGYIFWAMLVWRFLSYYIYILIGPLIYLRMKIEKRHKNKV